MDTERHSEPPINKLFRMAKKHGASALSLEVGRPPMMRLRGDVYRVDMRPLTQEDMERLVWPILYAEQRQGLDQGQEVAFTYAFEEGDVYRVEVACRGGQLSLSAHRPGET